MPRSNEDQKSRRERREIERKKKKFGPLIRKLEELDVRLQIFGSKLGQISAIMRNFTVCVMVMKEKGLITDEEISAKDAALRATKSDKDSKNPESSDIQPEGTGDDEGDSSDGGRELSGESDPDSDGGGESTEDTRETGSISSETDSGDTPDDIGGDD